MTAWMIGLLTAVIIAAITAGWGLGIAYARRLNRPDGEHDHEFIQGRVP